MKHCLVPYRRTGSITQSETKYNTIHSSTRFAIENTFGLLVARFRFMYKHLYVLSEHRMREIIVVCCILHNICITFGDSEEYLTELLQQNGDEIETDTSPLEWYLRVNNIDGAQFGFQDIQHELEHPPVQNDEVSVQEAGDIRISREGRARRDEVRDALL